jgi:16S rRNA (guanine966-N2)-methyltransferase
MNMAFVRIIAGSLGGRRIRVLDRPGLRPTQDRVRQAIFSSLGERVVGARVLDLCAGTGANGIEAWSRGAASITWIESDRATVKQLQENLRALQVPADAGLILHGDVLQMLALRRQDRYDGIFVDPPYHWRQENYKALMLAVRKVAAEGAWFVLETGSQYGEDLCELGWQRLSFKKYGDTRVHCFSAQ